LLAVPQNSANRRQTAGQKRAFLAGVIAVCILGSVVALERALPKPVTRYVVIHSDDAGMYPSVNQATIDAMERGIVSSCSILVPCPAFEEFASYAKRHRERDFGVHLDLNCERSTDRWGPVLGAARVPSLVDTQGFLLANPNDTAQRAKIEEVEAELRAQIERALAAGIQISHLDHHMFVLFKRPDFLRLYVRLGREFNLPIRYSVQMPASDDLNPDDKTLVQAYKEGLAIQQQRRMPVFYDIDTDNYNVRPEDKRKYFLDLFPRLKPGVTEILIHCAYGPEGPLHAPHADRREGDVRVFLSQETADALHRHGIRIISWREFRELNSSQSLVQGE
jgi:predicted glycoside hydrolase/deacetylase ChbG (UPF0249 family)